MTTDNQVGWYGKVPSVGDFVQRGLPDAFVQPWDDWLQRAMLHGRQDGAAFDDTLRDFPTWRFFVAPGVLGATAWCGVLQASADRVGRVFPFTIAQSLPVPRDYVCNTAWLEAQLDVFARTAVSALDQTSLARFESLAGALEPASTWLDIPAVSRMSGMPRKPEADQPTILPMTARLDDLMRHCAESDLTQALAGHVLWWIPPAHEDAGAALLAGSPLADDLLVVLLQAV